MPHLSFAAASRRTERFSGCVLMILAATEAESSRWVYWGPRVELIAVMKE
jgi:hypothetical protein